jgi:hypothetical protein
MKSFRIALAAACFAWGCCGGAAARSVESALRLMDVLEVEKSTTEATALTLVQLTAEFPGWKDHEDILLDYVEERLGWGALQPLVAAWVADHFTDEELEELIRFHSTPTGGKWVAMSPVLALRMEKWVRERFMADLDVLELRMKNRELERLMNESVFFDGVPAGHEPGE